jgi:hypothetical protein
MPTRSKAAIAGWAVSAVFCVPAIAAPEASGAMPGDQAMTCEQLASELVPYMQQMQPNMQALATSQQKQYEQGRVKGEERKREHELLTPMATAGALDPTGIAKRAYQAAVIAQAAKEKREDEAEANSPLAKQANAQREQLAAQAKQMKDNARITRLMQLGEQKGCTRK